MITLAEYMQGRDVSHALECSPDILRNAARMVDLANQALVNARFDSVVLSPRADGLMVNSGWRPLSLNAKTPGASKNSLHMTGEAIDINDPTGSLDAWCVKVCSSVLKDLGLWLEAPAATPGWCHLQCKPPRSGARIFNP